MHIPQAVADTIVDPAAYANGARIDEAFTWLRREAPLAVAEPEGYDRFWAVTRYTDIQAVERQSDLFRNEDRAVVLTTVEADQKTREMNGGSPHLTRSLVQMDAPDHFAYRRLTQGAFLPQTLRGLEDRIRVIAKAFVDEMQARGDRCDFARDVAFLYPLRVIMELMGVPQLDEPRMLRLTQELFGSTDPDLNRSGETVSQSKIASDLQQTKIDFMTFFNAMTEDRRRNPRNDLISTIANGVIDGQPLGDLEAMSYYIIIATAGHDTTSNAVAGGLWAIAENQDQFRQLKADPSLIPGFIEESIRWVTPVKHFMRTAAKDTMLADQAIAKGDWLMLCYPSGNRDDEIFADPFTFDIRRTVNKHLAFGYGAHVCLGQHLARMEMRVFWEELLSRLDRVEIDGKPENTVSNFVSGPKSVPICFGMHQQGASG
jgi:cytochrome P450